MRSVGSSASHCMDPSQQKDLDSHCMLSLGQSGEYCIEIPTFVFYNCAPGGNGWQLDDGLQEMAEHLPCYLCRFEVTRAMIKCTSLN